MSDAPRMHRYYQRYRLVAAAPIVQVDGSTVTVSIDGVERDIAVPPEFFDSGMPNVGDYLIAYPDPRTTTLWEPKENFEASYTLEGTGPEGPQGEQGEQGIQGEQGEQGLPGPSAVSTDAGNLAQLGSDNYILVPETSVLKGVTDGSEARPGDIGEYQVIANTTGVQMNSGVATQICAIHLEAGDFELWGTVDFTPPSNVSPNMIAGSISTHPNALPSDEDLMTGVGILNMFTTTALTSGQRQVLMTGQCRSNSAAPIDLYLVAQSMWNGSATVLGKGYLCARRVR